MLTPLQAATQPIVDRVLITTSFKPVSTTLPGTGEKPEITVTFTPANMADLHKEGLTAAVAPETSTRSSTSPITVDKALTFARYQIEFSPALSTYDALKLQGIVTALEEKVAEQANEDHPDQYLKLVSATKTAKHEYRIALGMPVSSKKHRQDSAVHFWRQPNRGEFRTLFESIDSEPRQLVETIEAHMQEYERGLGISRPLAPGHQITEDSESIRSNLDKTRHIQNQLSRLPFIPGERNDADMSRRQSLLNKWHSETPKGTQHATFINTNRFAQPHTWSELGIGSIVDLFCGIPSLAPDDPIPVHEGGINRDDPLLQRDITLQSGQDIEKLLHELEHSGAPFHVIRMPGTYAGSNERIFVMKYLWDPITPRASRWVGLLFVPPKAGSTSVHIKNLSYMKRSTQCFARVLLYSHLAATRRASLVVMSPPAPQAYRQGFKHLGFDIGNFGEGRHFSLSLFAEIGCDVQTYAFEKKEWTHIEQGYFDDPDTSTIWLVKLKEEIPYHYVGWNSSERKDGFSFTSNKEFKGKPSDFYREMCASGKEIEQVARARIAPSTAANALHFLTGIEQGKAQFKIFEMARKHGFFATYLDDFEILSHVLCKESPTTISATYSLAEPGNGRLGSLLNQNEGNLMLELFDDQGEMERYCYLASDLNGQHKQRAYPTSYDQDERDCSPSELLAYINEHHTNKEVRIISTEPFRADGMLPEKIPQNIQIAFGSFSETGWPVTDFKEEVKEFAQFIYRIYGGIPKEITNAMCVSYAKSKIEAAGDTGNHIQVRHRLHTGDTGLNLDFNKANYQLQYKTASETQRIIFYRISPYEHNAGAIIFVDQNDRKCFASGIDYIAREQRWQQFGPISILEIEGPNLALNEYLSPELDETDDSNADSNDIWSQESDAMEYDRDDFGEEYDFPLFENDETRNTENDVAGAAAQNDDDNAGYDSDIGGNEGADAGPEDNVTQPLSNKGKSRSRSPDLDDHSPAKRRA